MISHCFGTLAQFFQSNTFLTLSLGSSQFHIPSQGVRIQSSTFVQSEVPDNIFVVPILNSENQLVTIDLQFQKKLLALVYEDKNEQHKNPHCGVYMSFVRPHKSRPGHRALAPSTWIPDLSFPVRSSSTKTYFPINVFGGIKSLGLCFFFNSSI